MKLIDILVNKESEGWTWPDNSIKCLQDHDCEVRFFDYKGFNHSMSFVATILSDKYRHIGVSSQDLSHDYFVTREQYEAALAASKLPVWGGEGLPPVGCECEIARAANWMPVTIKFISDYHTIFKTFGGTEDCYQTCSLQFRPIRTEAERKREDAIKSMRDALGHAGGLTDVPSIYQAIASGKIPGIKLED